MEKGSEISKFSGRRISYRPQAALPTPPEMGPSSLAFSSDGNDVHLIWDSGRSGDMQVISTALSQSGVPVLQFETKWFLRSSEKSRDHLCPAFGKEGKSCDGTGGTHRIPEAELYSRFSLPHVSFKMQEVQVCFQQMCFDPEQAYTTKITSTRCSSSWCRARNR